jgi:hypothetical protein
MHMRTRIHEYQDEDTYTRVSWNETCDSLRRRIHAYEDGDTYTRVSWNQSCDSLSISKLVLIY